MSFDALELMRPLILLLHRSLRGKLVDLYLLLTDWCLTVIYLNLHFSVKDLHYI